MAVKPKTFIFCGKEFTVPASNTILYAFQQDENTVIVRMEGLETHPHIWQRGKRIDTPFHCPYYKKSAEEMVKEFQDALSEALFTEVKTANLLLKIFRWPYHALLHIVLILITLVRLMRAGAMTFAESGQSSTDESVVQALSKITVEQFNELANRNRWLFVSIYWLINIVSWLFLIFVIYRLF